MSSKGYFLISGVIFAIVALAHLLRVTQGWDIIVAGKVIPMWISWAGLVITAILAYFGLQLGSRRP